MCKRLSDAARQSGHRGRAAEISSPTRRRPRAPPETARPATKECPHASVPTPATLGVPAAASEPARPAGRRAAGHPGPGLLRRPRGDAGGRRDGAVDRPRPGRVPSQLRRPGRLRGRPRRRHRRPHRLPGLPQRVPRRAAGGRAAGLRRRRGHGRDLLHHPGEPLDPLPPHEPAGRLRRHRPPGPRPGRRGHHRGGLHLPGGLGEPDGAGRLHPGRPPRLHQQRRGDDARGPHRPQDPGAGVRRVPRPDPRDGRLPHSDGLRRGVHRAAGRGARRGREQRDLLLDPAALRDRRLLQPDLALRRLRLPGHQRRPAAGARRRRGRLPRDRRRHAGLLRGDLARRDRGDDDADGGGRRAGGRARRAGGLVPIYEEVARSFLTTAEDEQLYESIRALAPTEGGA